MTTNIYLSYYITMPGNRNIKFKNKPFTTPQIANLLGIPMRKILSYIERGYVSPSIADAKGHGSKRLWDTMDVIRVYTIHHCEILGLSVKLLRQIGRMLANNNTLMGAKTLILNEHGDCIPDGEPFEENIADDIWPAPWVYIPMQEIRNRIISLTESWE